MSAGMPFTLASLTEHMRAVFAQLPDARGSSNNQHYAMEDAALSAFSVPGSPAAHNQRAVNPRENPLHYDYRF